MGIAGEKTDCRCMDPLLCTFDKFSFLEDETQGQGSENCALPRGHVIGKMKVGLYLK